MQTHGFPYDKSLVPVASLDGDVRPQRVPNPGPNYQRRMHVFTNVPRAQVEQIVDHAHRRGCSMTTGVTSAAAMRKRSMPQRASNPGLSPRTLSILGYASIAGGVAVLAAPYAMRAFQR